MTRDDVVLARSSASRVGTVIPSGALTARGLDVVSSRARRDVVGVAVVDVIVVDDDDDDAPPSRDDAARENGQGGSEHDRAYIAARFGACGRSASRVGRARACGAFLVE